MRVLTALAGILLGTAAALAALFAWQVARFSIVDPGRLIASPSLPPTRAQHPLSPAPPPAASPEPHVVCEGCDRPPAITVTTGSSGAAGAVSAQFHHTPDVYVVLDGKPAYPHDLLREILERQQIGHVVFRVAMSDVGYAIRATRQDAGTYVVRPEDVVPAEDAALAVDFSVRFPRLTDAQFTFLRDKQDYRFVYGLIVAIVRHEGRHVGVLRKYAGELRGIMQSPITAPLTIPAGSATEFRKRATDEIFRVLRARVEDARARHEHAQDAIDDPSKTARITFTFEEEVNGDVPPPITSAFVGESVFSFELPPGPVPRPPVPNIPP